MAFSRISSGLLLGLILLCFARWIDAVVFDAESRKFDIFQNERTARRARDLQAILSLDYNNLLLGNIKQPSKEFVFPKQVEKKRLVNLMTTTHKIRHHGTHEHLKQLTIQISIGGIKYRIKLNRNEVLLSSGIVVKHFEENNQVITKTVEHCYYHGYIKKDEWSSVAVSTCNGLRGVIQLHNETYVIQPLMKEDNVEEHPHVIFKASVSKDEECGNNEGLWLPFQELHKGSLIRQVKFTKAQRNYQGEQDEQAKLLRIGMVLDNSMHMGLEFSHQHIIEYALDIANIVDMYFREIKFEVALTYLEYWKTRNQFPVDSHHRSLLKQFLLYKEKKLQNDMFDAAFFITGGQLDNHKIGIAVPESICSNRSVAVIKSGRPFEPQQTATMVAHMAGHILGIEHDEDGNCQCKDAFGCIMSTDVLGAGGHHSRMFSTCSEADLDTSIIMGLTSCLWGAPKQTMSFKQTCGNSIVERGEECDCGSPEDCAFKDPCCDPETCLLQPWAECRSGPCCNNCSFVATSHMCRPRQSECDVPEFCSGKSGDCPFNIYIDDGHPCAEGQGYCMGGICPTVTQQCRGIWGEGARGAHDQCYKRFNPTGNLNGHCGKDKDTGNLAKCLHDDILCGLLQCEGGSTSPRFGSDKSFITIHVNANNIEYECKTVHGPSMMDIPHMGMVQNGTRCGQGKICMKNSCVPLPNTPVISCPSTNLSTICSGHGVCAPNDLCYCDHGWEGEDCSVQSNITVAIPEEEQEERLAGLVVADGDRTTTTSSVGSEAKPILLGHGDRHRGGGADYKGDTDTPVTAPVTDGGGISTLLLIIILVTVIGGLFLAMGLTFFCYRRKSPPKSSLDSNVDSSSQKKSKHRHHKRRWGRKKKWHSSEDESEMSELPPPPVIVMDPDSAMPEKGILKNSSARLAQMDRGSSGGSNGSNGGSNNGDHDSVGPYMYDEDEDTEAAEICNIFRDESAENMDHLQESASFDFVIPPPPHPPPPQFPLPDYYPSPSNSRKPMYGDPHIQLLPQQQVPTWRTALPPQTLSPPQSRIVKLRNLGEYMQQMNKATIDLSPSPDEPPTQQLSPSTCTSEELRSSETEPDRNFPRVSHSDHSPTSVTSGSTQPKDRPSYGSLSQYILKRNDTNGADDSGSNHPNLSMQRNGYGPVSQGGPDQYMAYNNDLSMGYYPSAMMQHREDHSNVDMPPPMNPINIRTIFGLGPPGATTMSAREIGTPQGSMNGDNSSFSGTGNSKNGYEKSSGYGSEQDHERFSIDARSDSHSRSASLDRSHSSSPPSYSAVIRTGPNRIQLVPAGHLVEDGREIEGIQQELNRLLENLPRINAGSFERSPLQSSATPSTPLTGPLPANRPLKDDSSYGDNGTPCIDRSLEEIPAHFSDKKWSGKRPISVAVQGKTGSSDGSLDEMESLIHDNQQLA